MDPPPREAVCKVVALRDIETPGTPLYSMEILKPWRAGGMRHGSVCARQEGEIHGQRTAVVGRIAYAHGRRGIPPQGCTRTEQKNKKMKGREGKGRGKAIRNASPPRSPLLGRSLPLSQHAAGALPALPPTPKLLLSEMRAPLQPRRPLAPATLLPPCLLGPDTPPWHPGQGGVDGKRRKCMR